MTKQSQFIFRSLDTKTSDAQNYSSKFQRSRIKSTLLSSETIPLKRKHDSEALASSTPEIPGSKPLHQNDKADSVAAGHRTDTTTGQATDTWLCSAPLCLRVPGVLALPFSGSLFSSLSSILESGNNIGEVVIYPNTRGMLYSCYSGTLAVGTSAHKIICLLQNLNGAKLLSKIYQTDPLTKKQNGPNLYCYNLSPFSGFPLFNLVTPSQLLLSISPHPQNNLKEQPSNCPGAGSSLETKANVDAFFCLCNTSLLHSKGQLLKFSMQKGRIVKTVLCGTNHLIINISCQGEP